LNIFVQEHCGLFPDGSAFEIVYVVNFVLDDNAYADQVGVYTTRRLRTDEFVSEDFGGHYYQFARTVATSRGASRFDIASK